MKSLSSGVGFFFFFCNLAENVLFFAWAPGLSFAVTQVGRRKGEVTGGVAFGKCICSVPEGKQLNKTWFRYR